MCGHRRSHGFHGFFGHQWGRLKAEDLLRRLEDYRRDLEQELADISDLIRRLEEEEPKEATV
jgi:hypothetical protein